MDIINKQIIEFNVKYNQIIKKHYEEILLKILNNSKVVFKGKFKYNKNQSNGESDYHNDENEKFDAKILFDEYVCKIIDETKNINDNYIEYKNVIDAIINYANIDIIAERDTRFRKTKIYAEMKKRMKGLKCNESGILIFPFPIIQSIVYDIGCSNIFSAIYDSIIEEDENFVNKKMYLISMLTNGKCYLEELNSNKSEILSETVFNDYIKSEDWI